MITVHHLVQDVLNMMVRVYASFLGKKKYKRFSAPKCT